MSSWIWHCKQRQQKQNKQAGLHQTKELPLSKGKISWKDNLQNGRKHSQTILEKVLISNTYKELKQLDNEKANNSIKNGQKNLNRHIFKEEMQMVARYMKCCSTSSIIRKMQIRTIMRYLTSFGMVITKEITSVEEAVEKLGP